VDAHDLSAMWIPCGRETGLQRYDFAAGSMCHAGGICRETRGEIRWTITAAGKHITQFGGPVRPMSRSAIAVGAIAPRRFGMIAHARITGWRSTGGRKPNS
jgi:hypothetical protein